jgi:hypothetical protein
MLSPWIEDRRYWRRVELGSTLASYGVWKTVIELLTMLVSISNWFINLSQPLEDPDPMAFSRLFLEIRPPETEAITKRRNLICRIIDVVVVPKSSQLDPRKGAHYGRVKRLRGLDYYWHCPFCGAQ